MIRKILVPTDFSANAFKAVAYAAEIARVKKATIYLLHVIEPALNMATMQTDSLNKKVVKDRSDKLLLSLNAARAIYPDVKILPHVSGGKVVASINEFAEEKKVNLIVMGTTGAGGGLKKVFAGSVATGTISKSRIPVLTIPVSYHIREPKTVLFATNRFEKNKNLLKKLMDIPQLFSAEVHVVAFKEKNGEEFADMIYNKEQLDSYTGFLAENFPGVIFRGKVLTGEDFESAIDAYCNKKDCGIIAMTTYPKSFMERLLNKSVTKKMAFYSTLPILAIPAYTGNGSSSGNAIKS